MAQEKDKYSLWIAPKGEHGETLQALVDKLANENEAPHFVPHLTLVANIFADASELEDITSRVKQCAEQIEQFTLRFTEYGYMDEEFRSLYLRAESPELQAVYDRASTLFPQVKNEHFQGMPHMSVLYGNYSTESKLQMIAANPVQPIECTIDSLDLYLTNNPVESWRQVQAFPLA